MAIINPDKVALHCKACDSPLAEDWVDGELCPHCLQEVAKYNKDIISPEDRFTDLGFMQSFGSDYESVYEFFLTVEMEEQ